MPEEIDAWCCSYAVSLEGMLDDGMRDAADARCKDCRRLCDYHSAYGIEPYFASPSLLPGKRSGVLFLNQVGCKAQTLDVEIKFPERGRTIVVDFAELRYIYSADVSDFAAVVAALLLGKGVNR